MNTGSVIVSAHPRELTHGTSAPAQSEEEMEPVVAPETLAQIVQCDL